MSESQRKFLAAMLSIGLAASAQTPAVFAVGETNLPTPDPVSEAVQPGSNTVTAPLPLLQNKPVANAEGDDQTDPVNPTDPDNPNPDDLDNPDGPVDPVVEHVLKGTVYEHAYTKGTDSAKVSADKKLTITLGDGTTETVTSGADGTFSLDLDETKVAGSGTYSWSVEKDENYLAASGEIKENDDTQKLYIKERYEPKSSDYSFADSEDIISQILRIAGIYTIVPADGKKLAKTQDGEAKDSLQVKVADDGTIEDIYVYIGDDCSKVLTGEKAVIDDGAPQIKTISTSPAEEDTYVKTHGIYSKTKADILVNAEITEKGVGLKKVYLVGKKDDKTTTYDPIAVDHSKGEYTYSIALPEEETILDAEKMYLVAEDFFGNKSKETLIAQTEDGSSVTLEAIAPSLSVSVSSSPNANGWYNSLPTLTVTANDSLSGLAGMSLTEDEEELKSLTVDEKIRTDQKISAKAKIDKPSKSGKYTFLSSAKDNAGNEITKKTVLKIDLVAPKITASGVTTGEHYSTVPAIKVTEDELYYDADGAYISYSISRDGTQIASKTAAKVNELTIPTAMFDKDGVYKVVIEAKDAAGNESNTLSYEFIRDATSPSVAWSGIKNGGFYNKKQTATLTVKERFYKTNNVSVGGSRKRGDSSAKVGFPWKNEGVTSKSSKTFSEIGTYTLTASATDKAGNSSGKKTLTFTIDTKAPEITISGVKDGGIYTYGMGVAPKYKVTDDYPDKESVSYTKGGVPISNPSFAQIKENDGLYTMTVTATDKAGNTTTKTVSFTVNRFGSYFEYNDAIKEAMGNAFQNIDKDLIITEKDISKLTETENKIYKDGKAIENSAQTKEDGIEEGYNVYRHVFSKDLFSDEGAYEINVVSKDDAGNEMESADENGKITFYVDRTAPILSVDGIDPKGIKGETAELTINTSDLLTGVKEVTATANGSAVALKDNGSGSYTMTVHEGLRQPIHVTATDGAGNQAEFDDTVSVSSSSFSLFFDRFKLWLGLGAAALAAAIAGFIIAKRRRDDDEEEEEDEDDNN